ncbi:MAG: hypothetical protein CM1200mP41_19010 [Gammaproteobacteria bacterium]|nr:MAG: hypothetical protein CM1200mP41_19010 [Gammaproteobacteria bacterium]
MWSTGNAHFIGKLVDYMVWGPVFGAGAGRGGCGRYESKNNGGNKPDRCSAGEKFVLTLLNRFRPTLFTDRTPRKLLLKKLHSFFRLTRYVIVVIEKSMPSPPH